MGFHKTINTVNKLFSIARKGQLIVKDTEKVRKILEDNQLKKMETERVLGPKTNTRNRFKKVEG